MPIRANSDMPVDELVLERAADVQNEQADQKVAAHAVPLYEFVVQSVLRRELRPAPRR